MLTIKTKRKERMIAHPLLINYIYYTAIAAIIGISFFLFIAFASF